MTESNPPIPPPPGEGIPQQPNSPMVPPPAGAGTAKEAKAEAKAAAARAKALRPWYKKKRFILGGGLALLVLIAALGSGSASDDDEAAPSSESDRPETVSGNSENPPPDDVELESCGTSSFGSMEANLVVTNNSSGRSSYFINVSFESEDGSTQFDTGFAAVDNLEPGQSTTVEATSLSIDDAPAAFTCRITEVDRFSS